MVSVPKMVDVHFVAVHGDLAGDGGAVPLGSAPNVEDISAVVGVGTAVAGSTSNGGSGPQANLSAGAPGQPTRRPA